MCILATGFHFITALQIIPVLQKIMFIILPAYKSVPIPSATLVYCKSNNNNCIPLYWFISQDYWLDNVFTTTQ